MPERTPPRLRAVPVYALGDLEPDIHPDAYVHPDAVVIGNVTLGAESSVWPTAVLRGDDGRIDVGERTSVQDGTIIHCTATQPTMIGAGAPIGHNVHIEGATIGDGALIASGSVVLNGSAVGDGAVLGRAPWCPDGRRSRPRPMALGRPGAGPRGLPGARGHREHRRGRATSTARQAYRTELRRLEGVMARHEPLAGDRRGGLGAGAGPGRRR